MTVTIEDCWCRGFLTEQAMELTGASKEAIIAEYARLEIEMELFFNEQRNRNLS
jgi:hypothetical protein